MPLQSRSPARHNPDLATILGEARLIGEAALARAENVAAETGEGLDTVLTRLGIVAEDSLARTLSEALDLPLIDRHHLPAEVVAQDIPAPFLIDRRIVALARTPDALRIAMSNPLDHEALDALRLATGQTIETVVARVSDIDHANERLYGAGPARAAPSAESAVDDDDLTALRDLVSDAPVIRAINRLIADAVEAGASDIHLEPAEDRMVVRQRVDGELRPLPPLPMALRASLVSRIKVMANLDIAERRLPQDGRFRLAVRGREIDVRVATSPALHGESAVLRILDRKALALEASALGPSALAPSALGLADALATRFRAALDRPHGIVLVTGPTGSGKTTTLYAALAHLNRAERKLTTIEDPIEYRLEGVVQSQVNPAIGYGFAAALRSFLRQDPDVMMVGEIRDRETAEIAVQAALTGHMILSTLHTNTAAGAIGRLLDMGIEPFLLSSVLTAVMAQRLVRRLCADCREAVPVDHSIAEHFPQADGQPRQIWRATGCPVCQGTGYRGRVGLFELLPVERTMGDLILRRADAHAIDQAARAAGHASIRADGLAKVAAGLTSLEEVLRVTGGDGEP